MAFWKDFASKVDQKRVELSEEAKRRAAKKASDLAVEASKAVAKAVVRGAGKTLDYASATLEKALFGESDSASTPALTSSRSAEPRPDPFAKLKAESAAARSRDAAARVAVDPKKTP